MDPFRLTGSFGILLALLSETDTLGGSDSFLPPPLLFLPSFSDVLLSFVCVDIFVLFLEWSDDLELLELLFLDFEPFLDAFDFSLYYVNLNLRCTFVDPFRLTGSFGILLALLSETDTLGYCLLSLGGSASFLSTPLLLLPSFSNVLLSFDCVDVFLPDDLELLDLLLSDFEPFLGVCDLRKCWMIAFMSGVSPAAALWFHCSLIVCLSWSRISGGRLVAQSPWLITRSMYWSLLSRDLSFSALFRTFSLNFELPFLSLNFS